MIKDAGAALPEFELFVSFSSKDVARRIFGRQTNVVVEVKRALEVYRHPDTQRAFRVCTFEDDFELKPEVSATICSMIDRASAVLVMCTREASASKYVQLEISHTQRTKPADRLLAALVDLTPDALFPEAFSKDALAANFGSADLDSHRSWQKRLEIECAKVAARIWGVRLLELYDRFLVERQRRIIRLATAFSVLGLVLLAAVGLAIYNFVTTEQARSLAFHRRYAADMASVDRAWRSAGDIEQVKSLLGRYSDAAVAEDPRSFEWYAYQRLVTTERHSLGAQANPALASAVSNDGKLVAIATQDEPVRVFDPVSGQVVATLSTATKGATAMAFIAGKNTLMVFSAGQAHVWPGQESGETLLELPGVGKVRDFAIRPGRDEGMLVDDTGRVFHFELESGAAREMLRVEEQTQYRVAYAGGETAIIASGNGKVSVLDANTFAVRNSVILSDIRMEGALATAFDLAMIPSGDRIAILDTRTGLLSFSPHVGQYVTTVGLTENGNLFAVGGSWKGIELWQAPNLRDPSTWRYVEALRGFTGWPSSARFVPGASLLIGTTLGGDIKIWDTARIGKKDYVAHADVVFAARPLSPSGDIISADTSGLVRRWNAQSGETVWQQQLDSRSQGTAVAPALGQIAIAGDSGTVTLLDIASGDVAARRTGYAPIASALSGRLLAWISEDGSSIEVHSVEAKDASTITLRNTVLAGDANLDVVCLAISPDGATIAAGTSGGLLFLIDVRRMVVRKVRPLTDRIIWSLNFSPDGRHLAIGGSDNLVRIVDVQGAGDIAFLSGHWGAVVSIAFSPDGKTLASGGRDGVIRFWNTASWQETIALSAHQADLDPGVRTIAFGDSGDSFVSGGAQGRVIIWQGQVVGARLK